MTVGLADREVLRERLRHEREASRWLCARADTLRVQATELRRLTTEQRRCWQRWHRVWGRIVGGRPSRHPGAPQAQTPLVRVCMYCAAAYVALPLAGDEAEADVAWRPIPGWVHDQIRTGASYVVPSHGICPPCERRHELD